MSADYGAKTGTGFVSNEQAEVSRKERLRRLALEWLWRLVARKLDGLADAPAYHPQLDHTSFLPKLDFSISGPKTRFL